MRHYCHPPKSDEGILWFANDLASVYMFLGSGLDFDVYKVIYLRCICLARRERGQIEEESASLELEVDKFGLSTYAIENRIDQEYVEAPPDGRPSHKP